jgi:hypothetical protein
VSRVSCNSCYRPTWVLTLIKSYSNKLILLQTSHQRREAVGSLSVRLRVSSCVVKNEKELGRNLSGGTEGKHDRPQPRELLFPPSF